MLPIILLYRNSLSRISNGSLLTRSIDLTKRQFTIWSPLRQQIKQQQQPQPRPKPNMDAGQAELLASLRRKRPNLRGTTNFQISDGVNVSEWTLIYRNTSNSWLFTNVIIYSFVCTVCTAVALQEMSDRTKELRKTDQAPSIKTIVTQRAASYLLFSVGIFATMMRFRRCWVVRIYEKNVAKTGKPPASIVIESGAQPPKTPAPVREYCIVWVNFLFRRRLFYYKSDQTDRILEARPLVVNLVGNFRARNRPWAVFQHYFEDALDYYRVRGKKVAGNAYVA